MTNVDALVSNATANRKMCELEATAYRLWLAELMPANLILFVGAGLLSLFAGASILVEQHVIDHRAAGIAALASSAFTMIHTRLGCDEHQAECRKLQSIYQSLAVQYANLETECLPEKYKTRLDSLNAELANAKRSSAVPSPRSYARARRLTEANPAGATR